MGCGLYILGKDSSVFQSKGDSKVGTCPLTLVLTPYPDGHTRPGISHLLVVLSTYSITTWRRGVEWGCGVVHTWQRLFRILIENEFEGGVSITFPLTLVISPYPYGHAWPGISLSSCTGYILSNATWQRSSGSGGCGVLHTVDGS